MRQSQLTEVMSIKCLLCLGRVFYLEGPRDVDFKRTAVDQFI